MGYDDFFSHPCFISTKLRCKIFTDLETDAFFRNNQEALDTVKRSNFIRAVDLLEGEGNPGPVVGQAVEDFFGSHSNNNKRQRRMFQFDEAEASLSSTESSVRTIADEMTIDIESPLDQFSIHPIMLWDWFAPGEKLFFLLFLVLLLIVAALTLCKFRSPLYKDDFVKEIVRHHMSQGRPMILRYNWFGVYLHIKCHDDKKGEPGPQAKKET